jgi:hypothetical protein
MRKAILLIALCLLSVSAYAQVSLSQKTSTFAVVCTLAQNEACTTSAWPVGDLGGFTIMLWDSVKATTTGTISVRVQGSLLNTPASFTGTGYTDTTITGDVSITAAGWTQPFDHGDYCPRVPFQRYIILNTGDSAWTKLYFFGNVSQ